MSNNYNRRKFITRTCAAMGYTTVFSSLINMKAMVAAAIDNSNNLKDGEYKALVFLVLQGGNDSFNMLVPRDNTSYNEYVITRSNLAIPHAELLTINPLMSDGHLYGLHPNLGAFQNMFENGKMAFVSNVGTLVEPTSKQDFINGVVQTPLGLFSHADQLQQWQSGRPHERTNIGWGGRMADLIQSMNDNDQISMNISLNGINVFQYGQEVLPYVINHDGSIGIYEYGQNDPFHMLRDQALNSILERDYQDVYKNSYKNTIKASNDSSQFFQQAVDNIPEFNTPFPENELARDLRMIAKTIAARDTLGFSRQIFFVQLQGFDNHDELLFNHGDRMTVLNESLNYFNTVMEELNVQENVTLFNVSDFARTLTSNGNGTDHAWGGNMFVMGGAVNGKNIFGQYPSLILGNELELDNSGVIIPTLPTDMYFAELAKWFGVSNSDINMIFPNLIKFFDINSGNPPIGFMNI